MSNQSIVYWSYVANTVSDLALLVVAVCVIWLLFSVVLFALGELEPENKILRFCVVAFIISILVASFVPNGHTFLKIFMS